MRRLDFTNEERASILHFLLDGSSNGTLAHGRIKEATTKFNSSRRTISRLWAAAKKNKANGEPMQTTSKKWHSRKQKVFIDLALIESIPLCKRSSMRSLALGIHQSRATVGRWVKKGLIRAHTSAIKPDLTIPNKLLRVQFCLEALEYDRILNVLKFKSMHDTVHIDEKWFYITKGSHRFYLTKAEADPHRSCKNKKFITKVMFMCAVCRPIFAQDGSVLFDGKIGIFPFTEMIPAKRSSVNRIAGTMEQKPIQSINKDVIKDCVINKIIPAIKARWPVNASKVIKIQQDNARPHLKDSDQDFRVVATSDGFDIKLVHQPPNSPDTNINDLGWFRTIQTLQQETSCKSIDELVNAVINSFTVEDPVKLNKVFLTLQGCMVEILKVKGQNCYKVPHYGKDALIRAGMLPLNLDISGLLVKESLNHLIDEGMTDVSEALGRELGIVLIPNMNA